MFQLRKEFREDFDFAGPVTGGPDFAEFGVEGLVELVLEVGLVGVVAGADSDVGGAGDDMVVLGEGVVDDGVGVEVVFDVKEEVEDGEEEERDQQHEFYESDSLFLLSAGFHACGSHDNHRFQNLSSLSLSLPLRLRLP